MSTHAGPGGPSDRERLIESHLPLVRAIARRYAGYGETVEDLIQVGSIALIRASDRFDPERGVAFATFAAPAVEGEIRRHVGDQGGSVRIPRELRRMTGELERSRRRLAASLGRAPTVSELAVDLGVEHEDVERALEAQLAREPAPAASEDVVEAVGEVASLQSTDDRLLLAAGAHVLDDRERRIVFLRFHADMTERDIAQEVGISQAQVSRSLTRALAKLRTELEHSPAPTAGDTTKFPVVSGSERAAQAELRPSAGRKRPAAEPADTKIDTVGALEEQARSGQAEDTSPNQDLELPYHVTVKPEGGDGGSSWIASLDELPGSEARGTTPDEAVAKLRAAMEGWLSAAVDEPRVIAPPERSSSRRKKTSSHSGRFLVRMPSTLHEELTRAAEREPVCLNRVVTTQLAAAVASTGAGAAGYAPPTGTDSPPPSSSGKRNFRFLIAANLAIIVLAATAAIALLVLALERGI
jgi:RNA polymerase sigma-B factor